MSFLPELQGQRELISRLDSRLVDRVVVRQTCSLACFFGEGEIRVPLTGSSLKVDTIAIFVSDERQMHTQQLRAGQKYAAPVPVFSVSSRGICKVQLFLARIFEFILPLPGQLATRIPRESKFFQRHGLVQQLKLMRSAALPGMPGGDFLCLSAAPPDQRDAGENDQQYKVRVGYHEQAVIGQIRVR